MTFPYWNSGFGLVVKTGSNRFFRTCSLPTGGSRGKESSAPVSTKTPHPGVSGTVHIFIRLICPIAHTVVVSPLPFCGLTERTWTWSFLSWLRARRQEWDMCRSSAANFVVGNFQILRVLWKSFESHSNIFLIIKEMLNQITHQNPIKISDQSHMCMAPLSFGTTSWIARCA